MKAPFASECAYLAGLIDGEGSVQARHWKGPKGGYDYLLSLANTDERMVRWIASRWGGRVYAMAPRAATHLPQWVWRAHGSHAVGALEAALPYLITKREHAELALRLARSARVTGRAGYSDDERAEKVAIIDRLTVLNRRGRAA